jgi:LemA protein
VVRDFNTKLQTFPTNMFGSMLGFQPRQYFELETPADRENVVVKF